MFRAFFVLALVAVSRASTAQSANADVVTKPLTGPRQTVSHDGFTIDLTDVMSAADHDSVIKAVKEQLALVAKVKAPAATQAFFRTVPLVMQPISARARYGVGSHRDSTAFGGALRPRSSDPAA